MSAVHTPELDWYCSGGHAGAGGGDIASTHPESVGDAQSTPLPIIVPVQHKVPPPGAPPQPEPPHCPHAKSQQTFLPPEAAEIPQGQKPPAVSHRAFGAAVGALVVELAATNSHMRHADASRFCYAGHKRCVAALVVAAVHVAQSVCVIVRSSDRPLA